MDERKANLLVILSALNNYQENAPVKEKNIIKKQIKTIQNYFDSREQLSKLLEMLDCTSLPTMIDKSNIIDKTEITQILQETESSSYFAKNPTTEYSKGYIKGWDDARDYIGSCLDCDLE